MRTTTSVGLILTFVGFNLIIIASLLGIQACNRMAQEDTVNVEAFFKGDKDITSEAELANTFSYLMTGALHISNPPPINLEDIDQDALRRVLKPSFWARQKGNK